MIQNPREFGYYRVNNLEFFSKVEALEVSERINQPITFHYNDEVFSSYDWTKEPTETISHLYKRRVDQLVSEYDYIVLFYSGGADSHNMLMSFLESGHQPNEIVSFHSYEGDSDKTSVANRETFETAIPWVQHLKTRGQLKESVPHRILDLTQVILDFSKSIDWANFRYYINTVPSINNVARSHLRKSVKEWQTIIDSGKKLVLLWGHDKPRVAERYGKWLGEFVDVIDNCRSGWLQMENPSGWYDELFYSSPKLPEITIKQSHLVKNYLSQCPNNDFKLTKKVTGLGQHDRSGETWWLTQDGLSTIIYPYFNPKLYYEPKPMNSIYSKRDTWFYEKSEFGSIYKLEIDNLVKQFGDKWLLDNGRIVAPNLLRSKSYPLSSS